MLFPYLFFCFVAVKAIVAQSCENYGTTNGSRCSCPPGFGGSNCELLACGGTIFSGSNRPLAQISGDAKSNLTSCSCEAGWGGTGCNVCTSSSACQNAFNAANSNQSLSSTPGIGLTPQVQNSSLACNVQSRVYASGEMSCQVLNPTLQAIFPLQSNLTILRTLAPSLSPLPNTTSFGSPGSIFSQLIYDGVEQFYCTADNCTQSTSTAGTDWNCQDLKCTCRNGTSFCGGQSGAIDLTQTINALSGTLEINCMNPTSNSSSSNTSGTSCSFNQQILQSLFGQQGLSLSGCIFGECVAQSAIDSATGSNTTAAATSGNQLSSGVIAGLTVIGTIIAALLAALIFGKVSQSRAAKGGSGMVQRGGIGVRWEDVGYTTPAVRMMSWGLKGKSRDAERAEKDGSGKVILDAIGSTGIVRPGEMLAILGPSGAGKTTLVDIIAGKRKAGRMTGKVEFFDLEGNMIKKPRIGFVDQADTLPATLTPRETLLFAACLRLPESVSLASKVERVSHVLMQLGLDDVADVRIGDGEKRGISGGEMRRVSLGCELVAGCDVIVLDEPTSGLDSVSAAKVASVLYDIARDPESPIAVIASIHQPNSKLYMTFSHCLLLSRGHTLYSGPGGLAPAEYIASRGVARCPDGYNVADWLLEFASGAESTGIAKICTANTVQGGSGRTEDEKTNAGAGKVNSREKLVVGSRGEAFMRGVGSRYATTFLTQFEVLAGREWKNLKRDKTLFLTHVAIASVLGVFVGGLYFQTGITIAGFQSRVGCLFFLGALIAFTSLSALYNLVEIKPLFLRERAASYYSPTAWLLSRIVFDVIPLRIIPTIVVSTITYWMAGLAHDATHFFKFLFVLVLYSIAMTLFNFLLAALFRNGGVAILLSALTALYQQTYAGFFVHLGSIPPMLRWLQWFAPLKYTLEALSVNEVGSGLMIQDTLQGVPVSVSATVIMELLFGFGASNYYRDVLVLFAFIAGFGVMVIVVVWYKVRERR